MQIKCPVSTFQHIIGAYPVGCNIMLTYSWIVGHVHLTGLVYLRPWTCEMDPCSPPPLLLFFLSFLRENALRTLV